MADIESNIDLNIDVSEALASLKALQRQISATQQAMLKGSAANAAAAKSLQTNLINNINASGKFSASIQTIQTSTESFTSALEKNKFTMGQYFKYAGGASKTFGKLFRAEFDTINKVARERVKDLQTQYIKLGRDANGALKSIAIRPLVLDMENLGTKTAIAAQKQALMNQLLSQGSTQLLNFGKNTQWAGRQLMVGFTIPLMALGSAATKTFMQMEEQAIRFKRVYGDMFTTTEETNKALGDIKALANEYTKYGVAIEKTMGLAAEAAAQGKMGVDLMAQVVQATRLAVLGQVEQQEALETTISLQNAFGSSSQQLAGDINFLNAVENQTATSIQDLTIAIPKAGPVVKQLGGDVKDLAFFMTAMKEGGIDAGEGANALKSGLASMINPTKQATDMLAGFNINLKGIVDQNAGNVKQTVVDLAFALDELDPLNRAQAIEQLFGKFQFARMSTLFQNVIAEGSQATRVLELTQATAEELSVLSERELKRIEDSPMYKFKKAVEDLKASIVPLGEAFLKAITPVLEFAKGFIDRFNDMSDGAKNFIVRLTLILGGIGPVALMAFGLLANGVANIIKGFTAVKSIFNGTGSASKILGEQTNYLTQEQIEAAAVAASLEQSHQRLSQAFTSEASALRVLIDAYQRAAVAQNQMTAGRPGLITPPRKMANGGMVTGPGGPKDDAIPAMLSNGEAVIDAATVKKNPSIIAALFSGKTVKIPGFAENNSSTIDSFSTYTNAVGLHSKTVNSDLNSGNASPAMIASELRNASGKILAPIVHEIATQLGATSQAQINTMIANRPELISLAENVSEALAKELDNVVGTIGDPEYSVMFESKLKAEVQKLDAEVQAAADRVLTQITTIEDNTRIRIRKKSGGAQGQGRITTMSTVPSYKGKMQGYQKTALNFENGDLPDEPRLTHFTKTPKIKASLEELDSMFDKETLSGPAKKVRDRIEKGVIEIYKEGTDGLTVEVPAEAIKNSKDSFTKTIKRLYDEAIKGIKESTNQASPSKEAYDAGANIGIGAVRGIESQTDEAQRAGQGLGFKVTDKRGSQATGMIGSLPASPQVAQQILDQQAAKATPPRGFKNRLAEIALKRMGIDDDSLDQLAKEQSAQATTGGRRGRKAGGMVSGGLSSGKLAGIGMGLSTATMMASMLPGGVGEQAQKWLMPMTAISSILPLLSSGMGALIVAVMALAGAVMYSKQQFDKNQKAAMDMAESIGSGNKAMDQFAEAAGKATAGQIMDKSRSNKMSMFQIQSGKETFGESFVRGEQGQKLAKDLLKAKAELGNATTQAQLVNQMATAVASGAMSQQQARSIVANLGKEMGDYAFAINVNGKLLELLGPNGENLAKDPLEVRMKLMQESRENMNKATGQIMGATGMTGKDVHRGIGGVAAGAGIGAAAGSAVLPGIGTVVGAVVGAIAGGIVGAVERSNRIAKASGAVVGLQKEALQQQQQMIDSLDVTYQQRIEEARAAGNVAEADRLTNEYVKARGVMLAEQGKLSTDILNSYANASGGMTGGFSLFGLGGGAQAAMDSGADKAIAKTFEGTANEDMATLAGDAIKGASGLTDAQDYTLRIALSTGDIDPSLLFGFMEQFGSDQATMQATMNIVTTMGGAFAADTMQIANMFVDAEGNPLPDLQKEFVANISAKTPADAQKYLDVFATAKNVGEVVDLKTVMSYVLKNPQAQKKIEEGQKLIDQRKGKMDLKFVASVVGQPAVEAINRSAYNFAGLPDNQQKVFTSAVNTILSLQGSPEMIAAYEAWMTTAEGRGKAFEDFAVTKAIQVTTAGADLTSSVIDPVTPAPSGGGGGGKKEDPYEGILKDLQNVRDASIKASGGVKELMKLLGGKKDKIGAQFDGIKNQLTAMGASTEFVDMLAEADAKTQKLWFSMKKGNVVLTAAGKALRDAFDKRILGDFYLQQQQGIVGIGNQISAITKLRAAGLSSKDAAEMANDAELAGAIARSKNNAEIQKLIASYQKLKKVQEELALQTAEGMQAKFDEGFSKAMEAFGAKEQEIEIKFKIDNKSDLDLIAAQESKIAGINYQIDDYEAALREIALKEEAINKEYDKKKAALEQVKKINQDILNQQKSQLSIADALTSGDMAAAARAIQDSRSQQAQSALDSQGSALDLARQGAIDSVRAANGLSRVETEERIKDLQQQIFDIEEKQLEPARERIRLAEEKKQKDIEAITVGGLLKSEWEAIDNKTKLAKTSSEEYTTAIAAAKAMVQGVVDKWAEVPKKVTTVHEIITTGGGTSSSSSSGGGSGSGSGSGSSGSSTPPVTTTPIISDPDNANIREGRIPTPPKPPKTVKIPGLNKPVPFARGGMVKYLAGGGMSKGTDTVPAMLTPGEFVVNRSAARNNIGMLSALNAGGYADGMASRYRKMAQGRAMKMEHAYRTAAQEYSPRDFNQELATPERSYKAFDGDASVYSDNRSSQTSAPSDNSVYNYNLSVNVGGSNSSPEQIASVVMAKLQTLGSQQIKRQAIR
jgi:hypothetical protein